MLGRIWCARSNFYDGLTKRNDNHERIGQLKAQETEPDPQLEHAREEPD